MMAYSNYGVAFKINGVEVTLIYSGDRKVDGNFYEKFSKDVRVDFQTRIDVIRQMFVEKVFVYIGMFVQDVLDIEAVVFFGQEFLDNGLADEFVNNIDAFGVMREVFDRRKKIIFGGIMLLFFVLVVIIKLVDQVVIQIIVLVEQVIIVDTIIVFVVVFVDVSAQVIVVVVVENSRIMGILNCDEVKGRELQARVLVETSGMTVESVQRILVVVS